MTCSVDLVLARLADEKTTHRKGKELVSFTGHKRRAMPGSLGSLSGGTREPQGRRAAGPGRESLCGCYRGELTAR